MPGPSAVLHQGERPRGEDRERSVGDGLIRLTRHAHGSTGARPDRSGEPPHRARRHPAPSGLETDSGPRGEQGRFPTRGVEQDGVGVADQLPAAGGGARVDAAVPGGEGHRSGGDRGARLGTAGHVPHQVLRCSISPFRPRRAAPAGWAGRRPTPRDQVREPGSETTERGRPHGCGVCVNQCSGGEAQQVGHIIQILPGVHDRDHHLGATGEVEGPHAEVGQQVGELVRGGQGRADE